jgi:Icc-related predicted phosphoesterase
MRLLVLADIDDLHWQHGTGHADVLISCGDVSDSVILDAAQAWRCARIIAVKGNHDSPVAFAVPIMDGHLRVREHCGVIFGGFNGSWRYKPRGHFLYDQAEAAALLPGLPEADVLISHNSPRGVHDREDGVHCGFDGLRAYMERAKPRLLIHGHQHVDRETQVGVTRVIGVYGHKVIDIPAIGFASGRWRP